MGASLETSDSSWRAASLRRVVIVADDSLVVQAIHIAFRQAGEFKLVGYGHARRLTTPMILSAEPDAVLLDDMRRSAEVLALVREIREQDRDVTLIILSLELDSDWLSRAFDAGATAAISKETQPRALATLVRETIDGHIIHRPPDTAPGAATSYPTFGGERPLTKREREILQLVASGATNSDIGRRLWVTEQTVKFHLRNIYRKLNVANRTEASHFAHVRGLVGPPSPPATTARPLLSVVS